MTKEHRKTAKQFLIEERRKQVAIMIAQGMTEVEIASKFGVDNSTISTDVKALKLISQQFIYDIAKSDFTYYYKQCLDLVRLILKKQSEIVDKERITKEDVYRARILSDMLNTVNTIGEYCKAAPNLHRTPIQKAYDVDRFGVRPGTRIRKLTLEEEEALLKEMEEDDAAEESELKAFEYK
jgi:transposase